MFRSIYIILYTHHSSPIRLCIISYNIILWSNYYADYNIMGYRIQNIMVGKIQKIVAELGIVTIDRIDLTLTLNKSN